MNTSPVRLLGLSVALFFMVTPARADRPVISSSTAASGTVGQAFTYQIVATDSPTGYGATPLPPGVTVNPSTGLISGTPTAAGTTATTVTATNASGSRSITLTITIADAAPPTITSATAKGGETGTPLSYQITGTNTPSSFAASPLPAGLSVNPSTGLISGTPTEVATTVATLSATNSYGTGTGTLTFSIALGGLPGITSAATATGDAESPFSYQIVATNAPAGYSASPLPAGLSVDPSTGLISGTPSAAGTTTTTLGAANAVGAVSKTLTITISPAGLPAFTGTMAKSGTVGTALSHQIAATNAPTLYAASPLPAGLSLNPSTGLISGTPTAAGTTVTTLSATNAVGTRTATLTFTIAPAQLSTPHLRLLSVTRSPNSPLLTPATHPGISNNICMPAVIRVPSWLPNPLGKYYMYFAAHDGHYIRLAYADNLDGPWTNYTPGTLKDTEVPPFSNTISSPDVFAMETLRKIRMYFSCDNYPGSTEQWSGVAESANGVDFSLSSTVNIAKYYLRVFEYGGQYYGLQKGWSTAPMELGVSPDGIQRFDHIKTYTAEGSIRHFGILLKDDTLLLFYTKIGDAPERIMLATVRLSASAPANWDLSNSIEVMRPTTSWEGAGAPNVASVKGPARDANQLRDPFVFEEDGRTYLYYSIAGESGIAMAELTYEIIPDAPAITTQPLSQTVVAGTTAILTVVASGSPAPTYQWQKDGVDILGATLATLTLTNVSTAQAGSYTVVATNSAGTATSNAAMLTVNAPVPPAITTQPASQTIDSGTPASFAVVATGVPAPTFQWQKDGAPISGATDASFALPNVQGTDAGSYTVVATNFAGSVTSNPALLTVNVVLTPPAITTQPASQTVNAGGTAAFSVVITGSPLPAYQWRKNAVDIPGATGATLTLTNVGAGDDASYTVVVTNDAGTVTSAPAVLTVALGLDFYANAIVAAAAGDTWNEAITGTKWIRNAGSAYVAAAAEPDSYHTNGYVIRAGQIGLPIGGSVSTGTVPSSTFAGQWFIIDGFQGGSGLVDGSTGNTANGRLTVEPASTGAAVGPRGTIQGTTATYGPDQVTRAIYSANIVAAANSVVMTPGVPTTGLRQIFGSGGVITLTGTLTLDGSIGFGLPSGPNDMLFSIDSVVTGTGDIELSGGSAGGTWANGWVTWSFSNLQGWQGSLINVLHKHTLGIAANTDFYVTNPAARVAFATGSMGFIRLDADLSVGSGGFIFVNSGGQIPLADGMYDVASLNAAAAAAGQTFASGLGRVFVGRAIPSSSPGIATASPFATGLVGTTYAQTIEASGGTPPYTWTISAGSLPAGLTLSSFAGTIAGTPNAATTADFTVQVTDRDLVFATKVFRLIIDPAPTPPTIITPSPLPIGAVSVPYDQTLAADGGTAPYVWSVTSGSLPAGLTLSTAGVLSGTPASTAAASFTVQVTGDNGLSSTKDFALTISNPFAASIETQPQAQTVWAGDAASFTVVATGSPAPAYQWQKGGVNLSGATLATLTLPNAQPADAGSYVVVVTNSGGSVTSNAVLLTVNLPPVAPGITTQPAGQNVSVGADVTLTVVATGNPAPAYQWKKDGVDIAGATGASLVLLNVTTGDSAGYTVEITNSEGSVTSAAAVLTVQAGPVDYYVNATSTTVATDTWNAATVSKWTSNAGAAYGAATVGNDNYHTNGYVVQAGNIGAPLAGATSAGPPPASAFAGKNLVIDGFQTASGLTDGTITASMDGRLTFQLATSADSPIGPRGTAQGSTTVYAPHQVTHAAFTADITAAANSVPMTAGTATTGLRQIFAGTGVTTLDGTLALDGGIQFGVPSKINDVLFIINSAVTGNGNIELSGGSAGGSWTNGWVTWAFSNLRGWQGALIQVLHKHTLAITADTDFFATNPGALLAFPAEVQGFFKLDANVSVAAGKFVFVKTSGPAPLANGIYDAAALNTAATAAGAALPFASGTGRLYVGQALPSTSPGIITVNPLPAGANGIPYRCQLAAGGGAPPYAWTITGGSLPVGLTLSNDGEIRGTPTGAANASFTVQVADANGLFSNQSFVLTMNKGIPAITWPDPAAITYGAALSGAQLNATASVPGTFVYTPAAGTVLNAGPAQTLRVTFTPTDTANYTPATATQTLTVTPRDYAGVYLGPFASGGHWALYVRADNTATYLAYLPSRGSAIVKELTIGADGSFSITGTEIKPATSGVSGLAPAGPEAPALRAVAVAADYTLAGNIALDGGITGQLTGLGETFTGAMEPLTGPAQASAGLYTASALGTANGTTYAIVGASGQAVIVTTSATSVDGAAGTVSAAGQLSATTANGAALTVTIDRSAQTIRASLTPSGATTPIAYAGLPSTVTPVARVMNLSVRSVAGTGPETLIVGYVIVGSDPKTLLLRGVGPGLVPLGVINAIADPRLRLFNVGGTEIDANDDWGGTAQMSQNFAAVGAFALPADSKDAALFTPLPAGLYSFHVFPADTSTGVVLAEVYDADATSNAAHVVNLSARTQVGTGENILIAGFVIAGNSPKTLLIRGVGPTLTSYGVTGALADPQLNLFQGGANIDTNDNWGGTTEMKTAFATVGAAALASDTSKDAALLVTLEPGAYSAQVSGVGHTTGVALVEIFLLD